MPIHVATAFDNNYVQHAGVMLCSLFSNNPDENFHLHLFCHHVEQPSLRKLEEFLTGHHCVVHFYDVSLDNEKKLVVSGHISIASYLRVFLPAYLDSSIEKILYLDPDIIVKGNISELWETDVSNFYLAAVENVTPERKEILSDVDEYRYFNAGVLLINIMYWREHKVMEKVVSFIENNHTRLKWHDQDALNAVLYNKWLAVHPKYNMQGALFMDEFSCFRGNPDELKEAIDSPAIIHYSTPLKPWHYLSFHPYTNEYFNYLVHTPWQAFEPTDKNTVRFLRKIIRPYLRKLGIRKILGKHLY